MHQRLRYLMWGFGLVLILAACSSNSAASAAPASAAASVAAPSVAASEAASPSAAESAATSAAASASTGVTIALKTTSLGTFIVDAQGRTLYKFDKDTAGKPTCYDKCAGNWPALVATGTPTAGPGLDASKLTTVDRTDGTKQVKYGEYPLYYFANDKSAGDTNGEGVGKIWWVVGADGEEIKG
jgi:predicted lipoprotein with Yx(FWY)xxD motif